MGERGDKLMGRFLHGHKLLSERSAILLTGKVQIMACNVQPQAGVVLPAQPGGLAVGIALVYHFYNPVKSLKTLRHLGAQINQHAKSVGLLRIVAQQHGAAGTVKGRAGCPHMGHKL